MTLTVGDAVTSAEQLDDLPIGAVIAHAALGDRYTKSEEGWGIPSQRPPAEYLDLDGGNVVESLPDETPSEPMSLARFKQRFYTITRGAAQHSGISMGPVDAALRRLGVPRPEILEGMFVSMWDTALHRRLPMHTTLVGDGQIWGKSPNESLSRLLGSGDHPALFTVDTIPGYARVPLDVADEPDEITLFKARAWEVGVQAKHDRDWCSEFERAMKQAGVDGEPHPWLSPLQVSQLPIGAILRLPDGPHSVLYRRDNTSTNPARTVRIGGSLAGEWASRMILVRREGVTPIPVASVREMEGMPDGTAVTQHGITPPYVKSGHNWFNGEYTYQSRAFGGDWVYTVLP